MRAVRVDARDNCYKHSSKLAVLVSFLKCMIVGFLSLLFYLIILIVLGVKANRFCAVLEYDIILNLPLSTRESILRVLCFFLSMNESRAVHCTVLLAAVCANATPSLAT